MSMCVEAAAAASSTYEAQNNRQKCLDLIIGL